MADQLASQWLNQPASILAAQSGEDSETAVVCAIEERLAPVVPRRPAATNEQIDAQFVRLARMPVRDGRPVDEILAYDRNGLPQGF